MKIDFKKIINIKSKNQLKEYNINKPLFLNNYLFHYLIIVNNIDALKLDKFPIYKENNDNLNGFHLAAKENNIDILIYLIKEYPDYIYNKNSNNETFMNYLYYNSLIKLMKTYKNLVWDDLLTDKIVETIVINLDYDLLNEFMRLYKIDFRDNNNLLISLNSNSNISEKDKIKLYENIDDNNLNNIIIFCIKLSYYDLFNYLLERNININNINLIFECILNDYMNNEIKYTKKIFDKIEQINPIFYKLQDKLLDNILHKILYLRLSKNITITNTNFKLDELILNYADSECWNMYNIDHQSPLDIVLMLDHTFYSKFLIKNNIKINIDINEIKQSEINKEWINILKKLDKYNKQLNNIKIDNYPYINSSFYNAQEKDVKLFFIYLSKKYKNLLIPKIDNYKIKLLYNDIFWIKYKNENNYTINEYLNNIVNSERNNYNKRFLIVYLQIIYDNTNAHANLLIYDFKNMTIERFDPGGGIDDTIMDEILEEELTWNTGLTYIRPSLYMSYDGFQNISDERNMINKKPGDIGGYCLAWCIWYIETKMKNEDVNSKVLFSKLIDKLNNTGLKFSEYIRNYSNDLYKKIFKYLKEAGIDKKNYTNEIYSNEDYINLINYFDKKL